VVPCFFLAGIEAKSLTGLADDIGPVMSSLTPAPQLQGNNGVLSSEAGPYKSVENPPNISSSFHHHTTTLPQSIPTSTTIYKPLSHTQTTTINMSGSNNSQEPSTLKSYIDSATATVQNAVGSLTGKSTGTTKQRLAN
jgi:hypothetical protein